MGLIWGTLLFVLGVAGAIIIPVTARVVGDDVKEWLPWITRRLVELAVSRLPEQERDRFEEEWWAHIDDLPGNLAKVHAACGYLSASKAINHIAQFGDTTRIEEVARRAIDRARTPLLLGRGVRSPARKDVRRPLRPGTGRFDPMLSMRGTRAGSFRNRGLSCRGTANPSPSSGEFTGNLPSAGTQMAAASAGSREAANTARNLLVSARVRRRGKGMKFGPTSHQVGRKLRPQLAQSGDSPAVGNGRLGRPFDGKLVNDPQRSSSHANREPRGDAHGLLFDTKIPQS